MVTIWKSSVTSLLNYHVHIVESCPPAQVTTMPRKTFVGWRLKMKREASAFLRVRRLKVGVSHETYCTNLCLPFWLNCNLSTSFLPLSTIPSLVSLKEEEAWLTSLCISDSLEANYRKLCTCGAVAKKKKTHTQEVNVNMRVCRPQAGVRGSVWPSWYACMHIFSPKK